MAGDTGRSGLTVWGIMKKHIVMFLAVSIAVALLGSQSLWPKDRVTGMIIDGAMIGGGGLLLAIPFFTDMTETSDALCYTAGGILAASGITFLVLDALFRAPNTASVVRDNALLTAVQAHVSFAVSPDRVYLGLRCNLDAGGRGNASNAARPTPAAFLAPYPSPPPPVPRF
jgi:hypothetical protein